MSDTSDTSLSRLRWRCRRGMRELDRMLAGFLDHGYGELTAQEKRRFAELLELSDPDLYAYLLGRLNPEEPELDRLLVRIRAGSSAET